MKLVGDKESFMILHTDYGTCMFSYGLLIASESNDGQVVLYENWEDSRTTLKYLNKYLGTTCKREIKLYIDTGRYLLVSN